MSVYSFSTEELSVIALFAQNNGLGDAQIIANQLQAANLALYNTRYKIDSPCLPVTLVYGKDSNAMSVFRSIISLKANSIYDQSSYQDSPDSALFDAIKRATFCQPQGEQSFDSGDNIVIGSSVFRQRGAELSWAGYVIDFDWVAPSVTYDITAGMKEIRFSGQRAVVANWHGETRKLQFTYHHIEVLEPDTKDGLLSFQQAMGVKKKLFGESRLDTAQASIQQAAPKLDNQKITSSDPTDCIAHTDSVTMTLNEKQGGVEIRFPEDAKPDADLRHQLKTIHKFRFHGKGKHWYAKQTPARIAFAESITLHGGACVAQTAQEQQLVQEQENRRLLKIELIDTFNNAEALITKIEAAFRQGFNEIKKQSGTHFLFNSAMPAGGYPLKKPLVRQYAACLIKIKTLEDALKTPKTIGNQT